jgi:hypothetical protein
MRLYWGKGTCAIGIHILLEEAGLTYDTEQIDAGGHAPATVSSTQSEGEGADAGAMMAPC